MPKPYKRPAYEALMQDEADREAFEQAIKKAQRVVGELDKEIKQLTSCIKQAKKNLAPPTYIAGLLAELEDIAERAKIVKELANDLLTTF